MCLECICLLYLAGKHGKAARDNIEQVLELIKTVVRAKVAAFRHVRSDAVNSSLHLAWSLPDFIF